MPASQTHLQAIPSSSSKKASPSVGQTIADWLNPFSSTVPGDPLGGNVTDVVTKPVHTAEQVVHTAESVGSGVGDVATFITSGENWIRIGEVIAGVVLIVMGLRTLAGHDTTPISAAAGTVKTAAKVAR